MYLFHWSLLILAISVEAGVAQFALPMTSQKITQWVHEGTIDAQEVKRALREYVKAELKENCLDQITYIFQPQKIYSTIFI